MPTNARRQHRIGTGGPRGLGLAVAGLGGAIYGAAYAAPSALDEIPAALNFVSTYIPIWVWGLAWVAAGVWSIWRGVMPPQRRHDVVPLVVVITFWGAAYMVHWLYDGIWRGDWTREWRSAVLFGMLSGLLIVWSQLDNPLDFRPMTERG